jgi:hypothetical protein
VVFRDHSTKAVAKLVQVLPKGAHIHMHRTGAVRFPQFLHPFADKHERHSAAFVLLDPVERTADCIKERGKEQVVRDYSRRRCGKVFFMHLCAPFGRWIGPTGGL